MRALRYFYYTNPIEYTGEQLRSLYTYEKSGEPGDCILAFVGPMDVSTHMVDMEDVLRCDYIKSKLAINFIVEIFNTSLESTVLYQRLLVSKIRSSILKCFKGLDGENLLQSGDDLLYRNPVDNEFYKLTVSIATKSILSGLIHTGVNIYHTPDIPIKIISLQEIYNQLYNDEVDIVKSNVVDYLIKDILISYKEEFDSIQIACTKVRSV